MNQLLRNTIVGIAHTTFWVVFLLINTYAFQINEGWAFFTKYYSIFILLCVWAAISFYLFYNIFALRLLRLNGLYKYLGLSVFFSFGMTLLFHGLIFSLVPNLKQFMPPHSFWENVAGTFIISQSGSLVKGFVLWIDQQMQRNENEKLQLKNELHWLRQQINPHFLFNALNNIDGLIYNQPDKASEHIVALSNLLRYMLYKGNNDWVTISDEAHSIENLLEMHRIRHQQSDYIKYHVDISNPNALIAPILLIPFVENALKHGSYTGTYPVVDISIRADDRRLEFLCSNTFVGRSEKTEGGIGLNNSKRRLELLYPGQHQLCIDEKAPIFTVQLTLALK